MQPIHQIIDEVITSWASSVRVTGKTGKRLLQPSLALAIRNIGLVADEEDTGQMLKGGMPVWRSKDTNSIDPTTGRRRVDIAIYQESHLVALVETESDLDDLRLAGVTRRNGHYDVASIARSASGAHFNSYKSVERMAAAAYYWHVAHSSGTYPSAEDAVRRLEAVRSDDPAAHNPAGIGLFLVSGSCRDIDRPILAPRLASLGAHLICLSGTTA